MKIRAKKGTRIAIATELLFVPSWGGVEFWLSDIFRPVSVNTIRFHCQHSWGPEGGYTMINMYEESIEERMICCKILYVQTFVFSPGGFLNLALLQHQHLTAWNALFSIPVLPDGDVVFRLLLMDPFLWWHQVWEQPLFLMKVSTAELIHWEQWGLCWQFKKSLPSRWLH